MTDIFDLSGMPDAQIRLAEQAPVAQFQHGVSLIVVLDQAGLPFLRSLPTLVPQKYLREIIIVDRGAPDELMSCLDKIAQELPMLRIIPNKSKFSKERCMNMAARRAFGKYLLFVNQHALLPKDATLRLLLGFSGKPDKPTIISAKVNLLQSTNPPQLYDPKQATFALLGRDKTANQIPSSDQRESHVSAVTPGCYMIERTQFWLSDGFDTKLGEATHADLCLKMHLQGGGVYVVNDLPVRVYPVSRGAQPSPLKQNISWIKYYLKHYRQSTNRRWLAPLSVLLLLKGMVQTIKGLFQRKEKVQSSQEPSIKELLGRKDLV